jgi:hypothetical protein
MHRYCGGKSDAFTGILLQGVINLSKEINFKLFKNEVSRIISEPMGRKVTRLWAKTSNQYSQTSAARTDNVRNVDV